MADRTEDDQPETAAEKGQRSSKGPALLGRLLRRLSDDE